MSKKNNKQSNELKNSLNSKQNKNSSNSSNVKNSNKMGFESNCDDNSSGQNNCNDCK